MECKIMIRPEQAEAFKKAVEERGSSVTFTEETRSFVSATVDTQTCANALWIGYYFHQFEVDPDSFEEFPDPTV